MRTTLARLTLAGVFGLILSGCGGSGGTSLPTGGGPNGSGGGSINSSLGDGPPPAGTEPPRGVDSATAGVVGTEPYKAYGTTVGSDTLTSAGHALAFTPNGFTAEQFVYGGTVPNLTYMFGIPGNAATFNYNEIDIEGATYAGTPLPSSVAIELTGGSATSFYDVKLVCGGPPLSATAETLRCLFPSNGIYSAPSPTPSYYIANSYGAPSGVYTTTYTAPVAPATVGTYARPASAGVPPSLLFPLSTGTFTLNDASQKLYVVLSFGTPPTAAGTFSYASMTAIQ